MTPQKLDKAANVYDFERECKRLQRDEIELAFRLYAIRESNSWEGRYSSFSELLDANHIRRDVGTRMCRVVETYIIKHSIATSQLTGTSINFLYEAIPMLTEATPEKVLAMAKTNTIKELRDSKGEAKAGDHDHDWQEYHFKKCKVCGLSEGV